VLRVAHISTILEELHTCINVIILASYATLLATNTVIYTIKMYHKAVEQTTSQNKKIT